MLQLSYRKLRSFKKRVPKQIATLPTPPLRHGWGQIHRMSPSDRKEVIAGAWTQETPVHLVPDSSDRDSGGFVNGLCFRTDEEANEFLDQEYSDDVVERNIPTLQLARDFFTDLAETADSEVDINNVLETSIASDTQREDELRDVHRHFFADFYIEQGLINEQEKYHFVDAMLRPSRGMFCINTKTPLIRLIVRCQLDRHLLETQGKEGGAVFVPHPFHPLLYTLDMVPTQHLGETLRLPYSATRSVIAQRELINHPDQESSQVLLPISNENISAESLADALMEDVLNETETHDLASVNLTSPAVQMKNGNDLNFTKNQPHILKAPPSVDHLHWLQRQVAADTLIDVDLLGLMIPMILLPENHASGIILDMSSRSHDVKHYAYGRDISSYFDGLQEERATNIVVVSLAPYSRDVASGERGSVAPMSVADVPNDGERQADAHFLTESCVTVAIPSRHVWQALCSQCDAVLCCPSTTADGRRPRAVLGTADKKEEEEEAVPNRFVTVCSRVNKLFPYLCRELTQALEYASPRCGRVLYATHSMNPLENEAVVCAVLSDLSRRRPELRCRPVPLFSGLSNSDAALLRSLMSGGRHGLRVWVPLEDGPKSQDPASNVEGIAEAVADASWRSSPLTDGCDGFFLCAIEVNGVPDESSTGIFSNTPVEQPPELSSPYVWLNATRLRERFNLILSPDADALVASTPSTWHVANALRRANCRMVHSGSQVGDKTFVDSALSGTTLAWFLCESVRDECKPSHVIELPVPVLLELLDTRRLSPRKLRDSIGAESFAALSLYVSDTPCDTGHTVFVRVLPPEVFGEEEKDFVLHDVVKSELQRLVLVARGVPVDRKNGMTALLLESDTVTGRNTLSERVVAISDALRYLLRRLHYPTAEWRRGAAEAQGSDALEEPAEGIAVALQDDEYTVESPDGEMFIGAAERRRHERQMRQMAGMLRRMGEDPEGSPVNDWAKDLRCTRRST